MKMTRRRYRARVPRWLVAAGLGFAAAAIVLLEFNASPTRPVSWRPTPALTAWSNSFSPNDVLANPTRFECSGTGPESIAVNSLNGDIATGFNDGTIHLISDKDGNSRILANTRGTPLGLGFLADSSIVVADALHGLLHVDGSGKVSILSTESEGIPLYYPDGLIVDASGRYVYFTDVSTRHKPGPDLLEIIEHSGTGRLLRYDMRTQKTKTLLIDLQAANGVALGPGDAYAVVNESGAYRIRRYWLTGPMAGRSDVFADGLPGFPDNITFNGRDRFWVAIPEPRSHLLDGLAGAPWLRRLLTPFLVDTIFPSRPDARTVAVNLSGKPVASLEGRGPHVYVPITEAHEVGSRLILGSDDARCLASIKLP
jgi:DNA-binding beta-propeller fold protein YncE